MFGRAISRGVALGFLAAVILSACGGKVDAGCGAYFDAIVSVQEDCTGGAFQLIDPSMRAQYVAHCSAVSLAPGGANLEDQLAACTQAAKTGACSGAGIFDCRSRGTLADGAPCGSADQCAGGECNGGALVSPDSELVCGTCASFAAVGASCDSATCDPSQAACFVTSANGSVCAANVEQGGDCSLALCKRGLDCVGGTCQPLSSQGQPCSLYCQADLRCVGGTCQAGAQEGGPCPAGIECAPGLRCDSTAICRKPVVVTSGQDCSSPGTLCASGLSCTNGVCATPKTEGDSCTVGNFECGTYLICVSGKCAAPDYALCK